MREDDIAEKFRAQVNGWRIIVREKSSSGWRIAYLAVRQKYIGRLESHPQSHESFEPIYGTSILFVSQQKNLDAIHAFALDTPVIIRKNIFHGIITTNAEAGISITENSTVTCRYWNIRGLLTSAGYCAAT